MRKPMALFAETLVSLAIAGVAWEILVRLTGVPRYLLPAPSGVFAEARSVAPLLAYHSWLTISGTAISLLIGAALGVSIGLLIGYSTAASRLLYPLLGGFHAVPVSAFIPIFAVWFGLGMVPKVLAGVLIAFFPVAVNVVTGLRTIEPELWEMMRTLRASRWQVLQKVGIPRSVPYFFASLKLAAAGAFIGNVVAEMIASGAGLGYVLLVATNQMDMELAFAALIVLLLLGMFIFVAFDALEKWVAPWAFRAGENAEQ
jgi:NitT/TauT family transport system permease protein